MTHIDGRRPPGTSPDEYRALAIQCVAEVARLLPLLDAEVVRDAGRRDVRTTINAIRGILRVLEDATQRDGRWAHWKEPNP